MISEIISKKSKKVSYHFRKTHKCYWRTASHVCGWFPYLRQYARTTHGKAQTFNKEGNSPKIERR